MSNRNDPTLSTAFFFVVIFITDLFVSGWVFSEVWRLLVVPIGDAYLPGPVVVLSPSIGVLLYSAVVIARGLILPALNVSITSESRLMALVSYSFVRPLTLLTAAVVVHLVIGAIGVI